MAYTLSDLQSAVQDDLNDSSFSASRITRYLNYAQNVVFNTHMFRFCEKALVDAITDETATETLPTDHQATIGGALLDSDDLVKLVLDETTFLPHREFFERYPAPDNATSSVPSNWTEFGGVIYFSCPVDEAYELRLRYYRVPTAMASAADVPDVPVAFRDLLEMYAVYRCEKYRGNHDIAATYKQEFEDGLEAMVIRYTGTKIAASTAGQYRVRVGDA